MGTRCPPFGLARYFKYTVSKVGSGGAFNHSFIADDKRIRPSEKGDCSDGLAFIKRWWVQSNPSSARVGARCPPFGLARYFMYTVSKGGSGDGFNHSFITDGKRIRPSERCRADIAHHLNHLRFVGLETRPACRKMFRRPVEVGRILPEYSCPPNTCLRLAALCLDHFIAR